MDYNKIGNFIMSERKAKKLTQAKLAEKLFVSEKTISKWENGECIPDTNTLPKLCEILQVSINELLNGERISDKDYKINEETKSSELTRQDLIKSNKLMIRAYILSGVMVVLCLGVVFFASLFIENELISASVIAGSFILLIIGSFFVSIIEAVARCYECRNCNHKFTLTYKEVMFAIHIPSISYLKCPKCKKRTWAKRIK